MSYLFSLSLHNFRCYDSAKIDDISAGLVVIHGPNGAGKTNILEAISLLSPGRGLRKAKMLEMHRHGAGPPWAVSAWVMSGDISNQIGTGLEAQTSKRTVRINGVTSKSQAALADYFSCLWLTPQMDGLFLGGASERRRFLDRMIYSFDPAHAGRVNRYENVMRQRLKILQEGGGDPSWLDALEAQIAETAIAISASRLEFVAQLNQFISGLPDGDFPKAALEYCGFQEVELLGSGHSALQAEEALRIVYKDARGGDGRSGRCEFGPHRADLRVVFAEKQMPADQSSTGEQKSLLIGIVLAHAQMMAQHYGGVPVLLLDEVAAHLDEHRRAALYDILLDLGAQVFLTGTDVSVFEHIRDTAQFFHVQEGRICA